jgi:hypothetical protein
MPTVIPKVSEVKNLQDLSKVIVLPLIAVAYVLQTGLTLSLGGWTFTIPTLASPAGMVFWAVLIFTLKAVFISVAAVLTYVFLFYAHIWLMLFRFHLLPSVGLLFIAFGFYGVLTDGSADHIAVIHHSWFYTAFAVGFFLLQANTQFEDGGLPPLFSAGD